MDKTWEILARKYRCNKLNDKFPQNARLALKLLKNVIIACNLQTSDEIINLIDELVS